MLNLSESGELVAFWSSKYQMLPGKLFGILQRRLLEAVATARVMNGREEERRAEEVREEEVREIALESGLWS